VTVSAQEVGTQSVGRRGFAGRASRRLAREPLFAAGVAIMSLYVALAVLGPVLAGDPDASSGAFLEPPSSSHWFGTDRYGRDVFARAVVATRVDLVIGVVIAASALVIGSLIGVIAGYWGGIVDEVILRLTDILLALPGFVLALILVAALGNSIPNVVVAVTVGFIPYFIRLVRAEALLERELSYIQAARLAGNRRWQVAMKHVLPNAMGPALVQAAVVAGWAILTVAGLAFLGVGIRPPTAEWGVMVADGAPDIITGQWWTSLFPGGMIVIVVVAFHLLGDELQAGQTSGRV
jgi:peptide/nickel transport system permease protein